MAQRANVNDLLQRFREIWGERRLTVAAQGHVAELEQFVGHGPIPRPLAQAPGAHEGDGFVSSAAIASTSSRNSRGTAVRFTSQ